MQLWSNHKGKSCLGNKRNRNLPAKTRNFPKPKFGSGFVPAHFQASWFQFRYLVLNFLDFLVNQEVLPWIPGLTRKFLADQRNFPPNQIFAKVIFRPFLFFSLYFFIIVKNDFNAVPTHLWNVNFLKCNPKNPLGSNKALWNYRHNQKGWIFFCKTNLFTKAGYGHALKGAEWGLEVLVRVVFVRKSLIHQSGSYWLKPEFQEFLPVFLQPELEIHPVLIQFW